MVNSITMNLRTYLDQKKISPARFAGSIKVSVAALHRYLGGERIPRPEVLERIVEATDGTVQPNDFFAFAHSAPDVAAEPQAAE
jgi:transcriptional regulator with XRE-family HTH domain